MSLVNRVFRATVSVVLLAPTICYIFLSQTAYADFQSRKLTLSTSQINAANVTYTFTFTPAELGTTVKSMSFTACTTAGGGGTTTCVKPTNFSRDSSTLTTAPGAALGTGGTWAIDTTTSSGTAGTGGNLADSLLIRNSGNTGNPTGAAVTVAIGGVHNPNTANSTLTYFLRINSYSNDNYTGFIESGVTAAAVVMQITLNGYMPESLIFCVGANIDADTNNIPDCTTAISGTVSFNQLFSPSDTAFAISEMAASTNASHGYVITVNGATPTNGTASLAEMGTGTTPAAPAHGISQFGLNLVANTGGTYASAGAFGAAISLTSDGTNLKGRASTGFATADQFLFHTGDQVADSGQGGSGPTNGQIYTVSYIANVTGNQEAGTYTTDLTYICTPTF